MTKSTFVSGAEIIGEVRNIGKHTYFTGDLAVVRGKRRGEKFLVYWQSFVESELKPNERYVKAHEVLRETNGKWDFAQSYMRVFGKSI